MRWRNLTGLAVALAVMLALCQPATAHPDVDGTVHDLPPGITYPEFQGLGCIAGGTVAALGVMAYVELAAAAAVVGVAPPFIVATGFAFGCSVGALMAPGLWWLYHRL